MVYCGKPSKGCSNCRERKIRCDQREPGCGQCEKRQQQCPGYRNLVDLMFRDESSHVIKKANAKARRRTASSSSKSTIASSSSQSTTASPPRKGPTPKTLTWSPDRPTKPASSRKRPPGEDSPDSSSAEGSTSPPPSTYITTFQLSPPAVSRPRDYLGPAVIRHRKTSGPAVTRCSKTPSPIVKKEPGASSPNELPPPMPCIFAPSLEDKGLNLFIARYITVPENQYHHRFDFVFDFWKPSTSAAERASDPVFASITAVGLMGVAQLTQSPKPHNAARKSYGHALRLTNAALRDPAEAVKDSTMLSVLVLSLCEAMMDRSPRGLRAWQQHIHGAAALSRLRGLGQFRTKAGVKMFMMLCQNTMISCIQNELPMPQDLINLRNQLISLLGGPTAVPGYEVCVPIYNVLQLKYDIRQGNVTDIDEMLEKFYEAEGHFEYAISIFPQEWQYRKYQLTKRLPGFFNEVCHIYPAIAVANIWNGLRTCRLLILETMYEELRKRFWHVPVSKVPARYQIECQRTKFKMQRIALAILASIPQHFGLISDDTKDTFAPLPNAEDLWPQAPESDWEAPLGESESADSDSEEDEGYYSCRSPSLSNPMIAQGPEVHAERFMLLTSVTHTLVWPMYLVGMSTASTASMRAFTVEKLHAIHEETGFVQAKKLADAVVSHGQSTEQRSKSHGPADLNMWKDLLYNQSAQRPAAQPI